MFKNLSFRSKLALLLVFPLAALAVVTYGRVQERRAEVRDLRDFEEIEEAIESLAQLDLALGDEMLASGWFIANEGLRGGDELAAARGRTDAARDVYDAASENLRVEADQRPETFTERDLGRLTVFEADLGGLAILRTQIDGRQVSEDEAHR